MSFINDWLHVVRSLQIPLEIPRDYTASDLDEEHRLAYFREDLGINLHHWHWHLVYPNDAPREIVNKDRRGELFYYMHNQLLARYNAERFSNQLARVKRYVNIREPIPEGYFPKLDSLVSSRNWPPRHRNASLSVSRKVFDKKFLIRSLFNLIWRDTVWPPPNVLVPGSIPGTPFLLGFCVFLSINKANAFSIPFPNIYKFSFCLFKTFTKRFLCAEMCK